MLQLVLTGITWTLLAGAAWAGILGGQQQIVEFTKPAEAAKLATWSDPKNLNCTTAGFGWDGEANSSRDGWIETEPLAIGTAWRPPQSASIRVSLQTNYEAIVRSGNSKTFYTPGMFVRHSADRVHWSDWQPLSMDEDPQNAGSVLYSARIGVPYRSSRTYHEKLQEWSRREDIAWGSDEDEFCHWLTKTETKFFEHERPFVGYVQFLIEDSFKGGKRLTRFSADVSWGVGGIHSFPKKPGADKRADGSEAWSFRGQPIAPGTE